MKKTNPYNVQGISWESEAFLNEAKMRAKSLGLSLSNYVNQLVRNDLQDSGDMTIKPFELRDKNDLMHVAKKGASSAVKRVQGYGKKQKAGLPNDNKSSQAGGAAANSK